MLGARISIRDGEYVICDLCVGLWLVQIAWIWSWKSGWWGRALCKITCSFLEQYFMLLHSLQQRISKHFFGINNFEFLMHLRITCVWLSLLDRGVNGGGGDTGLYFLFFSVHLKGLLSSVQRENLGFSDCLTSELGGVMKEVCTKEWSWFVLGITGAAESSCKQSLAKQSLAFLYCCCQAWSLGLGLPWIFCSQLHPCQETFIKSGC